MISASSLTIDRATLWLSLDQNPKSRSQVEHLVELARDGNVVAQAQLAELMDTDISFGTAGLRAPMGPGFSRMNMITVQLATQGVAEWLKEKNARLVVVGHDHRHQSEEFAKVTVAVLQEWGLRVLTFGQKVVPTPFVPLAVQCHKADFGIMITASHNPALDNGYKVYGSNACQIMSPVDKEIAKFIKEQHYCLRKIASIVKDYNEETLYEETANRYIESTRARFQNIADTLMDIPCEAIYTPMHGVGLAMTQRLAQAFSVTLHPVPSQAEPNPNFPTCRFPNPEEGLTAYQEAVNFATSTHQHVRLILANDPDADRFNFAEPDEHYPGGWRIFTGNEIASLFVYFLWNHRHLLCSSDWAKDRKTSTNLEPNRFVVVSSCVSSKLIRAMAQKDGFQSVETFTGFKYIANTAQRLEREEQAVILLAYEEAIGYLVNTKVWDKDGMSALILATLLARYCWARNMTVASYLEEIYARYGYFTQYNSYYLGQVSQFTTLFAAIRKKLKQSGEILSKKSDLTGPCRIQVPNEPSLIIHQIKDYPGTTMITLYLDAQGLSWLTYRASGTEPKVKFYSEMTSSSSACSPSTGTNDEQKEHLQNTLKKHVFVLNEWLLDPIRNNLSIQIGTKVKESD